MATSTGPAPIQPVRSGINLLDNWYFMGGGSQQGGGQFPINQRGQTSYTLGNRTTIDGVVLRNNTSLSIESDHIHIEQTNTGGKKGIIFPNLTTKFVSLQGRSVTLSIVAKGTGTGEINCSHSDTINGNSGNYLSLNFNPDDTYRLYTISGVLQNLSQTCFNTWIGINDNSTLDVKAIKLELGDTQTLAHQENGVWVLNDPPPNYDMELLKCQLSTVDSSDAYANKKIQFATT